MTIKVDRISRVLMRRSIRILDMEYKPSEIAEELGASKEQILRLVSAGAPARKDAEGRFWINGFVFVSWLKEVAPKRIGDKATFEDDECYCFTCRSIVKFKETRRKERMVYGICPGGHKVTRFISLSSPRKEKYENQD
jgi:hypothetical protein